MLKFLFFIFFFIILLGFLAGFSIIRSVRDALFGPSSNSRKTSRQHRTGSGRNTSREQTDNSSRSKKKIFKKDEGEYIDYEEVE